MVHCVLVWSTTDDYRRYRCRNNGQYVGNIGARCVELCCILGWIFLNYCSCGWRSVTNATALMGSWVLFTLVLPTLANVALVRAIPVHQGVDLMLAQRQFVHGA